MVPVSQANVKPEQATDRYPLVESGDWYWLLIVDGETAVYERPFQSLIEALDEVTRIDADCIEIENLDAVYHARCGRCGATADHEDWLYPTWESAREAIEDTVTLHLVDEQRALCVDCIPEGGQQ